jgi:hypothetical protein
VQKLTAAEKHHMRASEATAWTPHPGGKLSAQRWLPLF